MRHFDSQLFLVLCGGLLLAATIAAASYHSDDDELGNQLELAIRLANSNTRISLPSYFSNDTKRGGQHGGGHSGGSQYGGGHYGVGHYGGGRNEPDSVSSESQESYERSGEGNGDVHPCRRECKRGQARSCYYKLVVHKAQRLGPECQRCLHDPNACDEEQCLYGDGVANPVMAANGQIPMPLIEACVGDTLIVDVVNKLVEPTTLHWHGLLMSQTPEMDGVPFVTQYPVQPGEVYRYSFVADHVGTLWYHSHVGDQRAFGLAGCLVIREPKKTNRQLHLYDNDLSEHTLMIQDIPYGPVANSPVNILINGKGRNHLSTVADHDEQHRYEALWVDPGRRYRIRVVFNGIFSCPIELSVDQHKMQIISTDGNDIEPTWADSFTLTSGERLDFVLHADQPQGSYWLRVSGFDSCASNNQTLYQLAELHYTDRRYNWRSGKSRPRRQIAAGSRFRGKKVVVNAFMELMKPNYRLHLARRMGNAQAAQAVSSEDNESEDDIVNTASLRSLNPLPWPPYTKFQTFYSKFGIRRNSDGEILFQIDDISHKMANISLLQGRDLFDQEEFYSNTTSWPEGVCSTQKCEGTHVIRMPANQPIEMVVGNGMATSHPFHIHGFIFRVVGQEILENAEDLSRLPELDRLGLLKRNPEDFPSVEKDTLQIPGRGYIIVRFISNNPGFWLYHCHIEEHAKRGMMAVLKVGEDHNMKVIKPKVNC